MQRGVLYECCLIMQFLCLLFVCGCSNPRYSPVEKSREARQEEASQDIYDLLKDYPALEAFFTTGNLTKGTFEDKLFKELLGSQKNADMLIAILDGLPLLFEPRSVPDGIFDVQIESEMERKGPLPDLFSALACLPRHIIALPEAEKKALYAYLDTLVSADRNHPGTPAIRMSIRGIANDLFAYLTTCDTETVNTVMDLLIRDLIAKQAHQTGALDFSDIDAEIGEITTRAPENLAMMLQGGREMLSQKEAQAVVTDFLSALGRFLGDRALYAQTRTLLTNLDTVYDKQTLGDILERVWTKGAVPGTTVEKMGIEGYGKAGKIDANLRELLTQPRIVNAMIETIAAFDREGFHMDGVDTQLREYVMRDPFLQARDGAGEFGNGRFYTPNPQFSYQHFCGLRGFLRYVARWNVPLTLTSNFLYENRRGGAWTKSVLRAVMPTVDAVPFASLIWADVYEKGSGYAYGHGHPIREQRGYGMMVDGVYVAPLSPDVITGASMALAQVGVGLLHGPYDNIYDNMRWVLYERNYYMTIDLVQFTRRIPVLDIVARPYFLAHGITTLPIILKHTQGIFPVIYMDLNDVLSGVLQQMNLSGLPDSLKALLIDVIFKVFPMGSPAPGSDRIFLLPQDMRDLWTIVGSLGYYDPAAFHPDRFLDINDPARYTLYYDVSAYSYTGNRAKTNPIFPLVGALCVSAYAQYSEVVDQFPSSLDALEIRQAAARKAFGGVVFPLQYIVDLLAPLTEQPLDMPTYSRDDGQMTLVKSLEPLFDREASGMIDAIVQGVCILGRPEMRETRYKLLNALAALAATTQKDTSTGPYALAAEILSTPHRARNDPRYWEALRFEMDAGAMLLSSQYRIIENIRTLISELADSELPEDDAARLAMGMTSILARCAEERFFARGLIDLSDILKHLNTSHAWGDMAGLMQDTLDDDGILTYLLLGLERDPRYAWDQIINDTDRFLHSDVMMKCDEGSFWDGMNHLIRFMVHAID